MVVYENMKQKIIAKYMTKFIPIKKETEVKRKDGMNKHTSRHYIKKIFQNKCTIIRISCVTVYYHSLYYIIKTSEKKIRGNIHLKAMIISIQLGGKKLNIY